MSRKVNARVPEAAGAGTAGTGTAGAWEDCASEHIALATMAKLTKNRSRNGQGRIDAY
jgi:accessory colonization factor AcfC